MFQDEAGFGRISTPSYCWCPAKIRPNVLCHRVREYVYLFGAVEPATGENFFLIMDKSNTVCMNAFLENLSKEYADDIIILVCDNAPWHEGGAGYDSGEYYDSQYSSVYTGNESD